VNNLPTAIIRQRGDQESNSQPPSCESNALTTRLPSHPVNSQTTAKTANYQDERQEVQKDAEEEPAVVGKAVEVAYLLHTCLSPDFP